MFLSSFIHAISLWVRGAQDPGPCLGPPPPRLCAVCGPTGQLGLVESANKGIPVEVRDFLAGRSCSARAQLKTLGLELLMSAQPHLHSISRLQDRKILATRTSCVSRGIPPFQPWQDIHIEASCALLWLLRLEDGMRRSAHHFLKTSIKEWEGEHGVRDLRDEFPTLIFRSLQSIYIYAIFTSRWASTSTNKHHPAAPPRFPPLAEPGRAPAYF